MNGTNVRPVAWTRPSGKVGNLRVVARQNLELQLGCGFLGEAGMLLSEPCCLRLAATVDAKQHHRRWVGLKSRAANPTRFQYPRGW